MKYLLLLFLILSLSIFPQNYKKIKLLINNQAELQKAISLQLDFEHSVIEKEGGLILFVDENEFKKLVISGLGYQVLIDDWKAYYNSLPKLTDVEKEIFKLESKQKFGVTGFDYGSMGGYYTLAEIEADLDEMFQLFPNLITQKFSIGTSIEGRTIWAVKISDNPNVNENEPTTGFDALVHAREPQSMATLMYFMWYLLENYGVDPEVTYLVNNREIYCVPCFNPDGYEYNHLTNPNGGGMWRKNRRNNGGCYGVDLNRNFGYMWGYDNIGSSPDPCDETYRGASAFSEQEAQAIRDLALQKNYKTHFNMHAYGSYFLYPFGYIDQETPDSLTYREFAGDMSNLNGYDFGTGPQLLGYPSNGSIHDWMYGEQTLKNKTYGYTIKIGYDFWPAQSQIFPIAQQNVKSNLYQAMVAGEYIEIADPNFVNDYFLPGDFVQLEPEVRNKGLAAAYNLHFEISSPSQYINTKTFFVEMDSLEAGNSTILFPSFSFLILYTVPGDEEIPLVLTTSINGSISRSDTMIITIGYPVYVFADTANNPLTHWTITKTPSSSPQWDSTYKTFYSPPNSYTDSRNGKYINNATVTMTLTNPLNLTEYSKPRLTFKTKYSIENNYDYGQVQISTNDGSTWISLEGKYTQPGEGDFQPTGEPVYDGLRSNWAKEEINLADYISSQFKIRFQLKTDNDTTRDGWYVDDIGVFNYTISTDIKIKDQPVYFYSLQQNFPNPFNPATSIKYSLAEDGMVNLSVFNLLGEKVLTLVNENQLTGNYDVKLEAGELTSGIYFYKLQAGNYSKTMKMILLK